MQWLHWIHWKRLFGFGPAAGVPPTPALKKLALGVQAMQAGKLDEALKLLDQALILDPRSTQALIIRSKIHHDQGRTSDALADCGEIIRIDPANVTALTLRSAFYVMSGEPENALADLRAADKLKPGNAGLKHQIALLLHETQKFEEAVVAYTGLIEAKPNARLYLARGRCQADLKKYAAAIADFNEALRLDSNLLEAVDARAHAAADAAQFGEAIQDYSEYLKLHPRDAATYYNRALSRRKSGDIPAALADYTRAIELDPQFEKAFFNRGFAYNRLGDYANAEADFRKAVELEPGKPGPSNGLAWLFATCPDARVRNGAAAVEWAQKAFDASEGKVKNVYDTMAAAYAELGEFPAAIEWQQRYLKLDLTPEEADSGRKRLVLYQAGQPFREDPPVGVKG